MNNPTQNQNPYAQPQYQQPPQQQQYQQPQNQTNYPNPQQHQQAYIDIKGRRYMDVRLAALEVTKNLNKTKITTIIGIAGTFITLIGSTLSTFGGSIGVIATVAALIYFLVNAETEKKRLKNTYQI